MLAQKRAQLGLIGAVGAAASALGILFALGLAYRLREKAPTRALTQLYLAVVGLASFSIDGFMRTMGGVYLAGLQDQVAAGHAYAALNGVGLGLNGVGNAFTGVSLLLVAWAIIGTGAMRSALGWVAAVTGVVTVIAAYAQTSEVVFLGSLVLLIIWLVWGGFELRRGPVPS